MKQIKLVLVVFLSFIFSLANAQKPVKKPKAPVKAVMKCHVPADSTVTLKLKIDQVKAWADSLPLAVICSDFKKYKLFSFDFSIITLNPFQTKEFGTGNGGIPILARKAIDTLQPKDGIIIKNATYKDEKGVEQKLPIITFSIIE